MMWTEELPRLPDAIWRLSPDSLTVRAVTWEDERLFGFTRDDLVGTPLTRLVPGASPALLRRALEGTHDPHPDTPLRLAVRTADGSDLPVDLRVARAADGSDLLVVMRLISQRARIAERELVTVIAAAPEAIVTWLPAGRIVSWNPAAERLYDIPASQALGMSVENLVPTAGREEFRDAVASVLRDGALRRREVFRLRKGLEIEVEETLFLLRDLAQQPIGIGSFTRDLFELSRLRRVAETLSRVGTPARARVGESRAPVMQQAYGAIEAAAAAPDTAVLLLGETGVGKTVLARHIHTLGPRRKGPFLAINCATLEANLAESELFGHERGAFTGAQQQKRGLVEAAHGGTLFLDEIGELPPSVQAKLLTFLDTHAYRRVGAVRDLHADVRILAATNVQLVEAVEAGSFRRDLYYRLGVLPIRIPPLRERLEDLPEIVSAMLAQLPRRSGRISTLHEDALEALRAYSWPGNLRELRNALERGHLLARGGTIERRHLPDEIQHATRRRRPETTPTRTAEATAGTTMGAGGLPGGASEDRATEDRASAERGPRRLDRRADQQILEVLAAMDGHRGRAAEALGISRSTLLRKLKKLGVPGRRRLGGAPPAPAPPEAEGG